MDKNKVNHALFEKKYPIDNLSLEEIPQYQSIMHFCHASWLLFPNIGSQIDILSRK